MIKELFVCYKMLRILQQRTNIKIAYDMCNINKLLFSGKTIEAVEECLSKDYYYLGRLLCYSHVKHNKYSRKLIEILENVSYDCEKHDGIVIQEAIDNNISGPSISTILSEEISIQLYCNWCDSKELAKRWNKMTKGNYRWNNIHVVWNNKPDYYIILNKPPENAKIIPERTIIFHMEPNMDKHPELWGKWSIPNKNMYLQVIDHTFGHNNIEWHISKTYQELMDENIVKTKVFSTILSDKYYDPGHIKRIDFVHYLDDNDVQIDVYGTDKDYKNFKHSLPYHTKDKGLLPYKYTFNVENNSIPNYFTEKLIDGILSECLVFYSGCENVKEYIDENAFVYLELKNFEQDLELIKKAIKEDWYTKRLSYIKAAKEKILNELQFFPRLENIFLKE